MSVPCVPDHEEAVMLLFTSIFCITIIVGRFTSDLHPVFLCGLAYQHNDLKSKFAKKIMSCMKMDSKIVNLINQWKKNITTITISCCVDKPNVLPSHKVHHFFIELRINPTIAVSSLSNGSFCKIMMQLHYQHFHQHGKSVKDSCMKNYKIGH